MKSHKFLPSRSGAVFGAEVEVESDGALTILSNDGAGYRSAHRDFAAEHFEHKAMLCSGRLTWVNTSGARVVLTRWHTAQHAESKG